MSDLLFELPLPELFNWEACLDYMARSPLECLYRTDEEGVTRLFHGDGQPLLIRLVSPVPGRLSVVLLDGEPPGEDAAAALARYITDWFDLDRDLRPFYELAGSDHLLGPLTERYRGLRIVGIPDLFEALCWAILGQQVNLAFAYRLKARLAEQYGESMLWEGHRYHLFPEPEALLAASEEELCTLQLSRGKARTIRTVATLIAGGELSRAELLALPNSEAMLARLTSIQGIGPWTAHYVGMRCLYDAGAFPVTDVGLHNAVRSLLGMDRKPTVAELTEMFGKWRGWEAYATFYLWRALY
ncbi:DNA-3-methyladenine glycosylase 2 family protein [Paenibacillus sp. HN-1]|uniref:DNA-3-methyladenine glycosylase 2 n=1 Tax=Paenibacillus TaxID=44249 RepID=UPI001CAA1BFD|nr:MULTISPECIES: DNA-3-methyladenine glycosylase [Paenibacillus]MBY9080155.1 DNA-3-methyladenine glycosylase 2 family protein [Paenibacillus sp. CGMCC 1.18879]MBY9087771.1 DNA-3-methyladenine glycosylase 2 family protein [Paenibacillus sinensis]